MQHPGILVRVAARFAAVACEPVKGAVLDEATLHGGIQWGVEGQGDSPRRVHLHPCSGGSKFGCGSQ
ncbi:hypothetical protein D3C77_635280 [compost metagenome]